MSHKAVKENEKHSQVPTVPENYNPYVKMEQLAEKQKQQGNTGQVQRAPDHNKNAKTRAEILGEKSLPIKQRVENQKFVKG
jgi:hypothetical protein